MSLGPAEELSPYVDPDDRCSECGRQPRAVEHALDDWRIEFDAVGEPYVFCPECWGREFGDGRMD